MHSNSAGQPNTSQNDLTLSYVPPIMMGSLGMTTARQGHKNVFEGILVSTSVIVGTAIQLSSDIIRSDYMYIYIYYINTYFHAIPEISMVFCSTSLSLTKTVDLQPWSSMFHGRHQESFK